MGTRIASILLFAGIGLLAGCVSQPPRPELIAAAFRDPTTPASVSGELINQCLVEAFRDNLRGQGYTGAYNPVATLNITREMARGGGPIASYAPRIRAYIARPYIEALFRTGYVDVICLYELRGTELRYLSLIVTRPGGAVFRDHLSGAINKAYIKMSGKDPVRLMIFGDY
jgi:hypothetical protein